MEFFIRQNISPKHLRSKKVKELKQILRNRNLKVSGRKNELIKRLVATSKCLYSSSSPITQIHFESLCDGWGEGDYALCVKGEGIKGNKILNNYSVFLDGVCEVFNAETIAVNQKLSLTQLNNAELVDLMGNMIKNAPSDAEGHTKFINDLQKFHSEISERGLNQQLHSAEADTLVSAGFPIKNSVTPFLIGALSGGVIVYAIQKKEINELNSQISNLQKSINDAEEAIDGIKQKAEQLEPKKLSAEEVFLRQYNLMNRLRP